MQTQPTPEPPIRPQMHAVGDSRNAAIARWLAILLLLVAGALVYTVLSQRNATSSGATSHTSAQPRAVTARGDLAQDEKSTIELFRSASPSVVHITSLESRRSRLSFDVFNIPQGTGSGFMWDKKGHVVTNFHVIQHADHAEVTLSDNSVWKGEIVGVEPDKDLAVLRIDAPAEKLKPISVGTSGNLLVGQKVFAIGNPFGLDQTLTTGVISGLGREITSVTKRPIYDVIQTDAPINPGNSGGPLLDSAARVIGVNTAIYSPTGSSAGIGFAVPIDTINLIVPKLIANGRLVHPGLGIHIGSDAIATQLNLEGVLVVDVPDNSAAGRAGIEGTKRGPGGKWILGDVIVGLDNQPIRSSADLFRALDQHKVGDTVTVTVERNRERRQVEVTLQALP